MKKQEIWFVINPISGGGQTVARMEELIGQYLSQEKYDYALKYTGHRNHAYEIARQAVANAVPIIVAAGGDGTIHEIARALVGSATVLGILPIGSGNGLAKHLGIPMDVKGAIERLNDQVLQKLDVGYVNDLPFLIACGIGFDAHCARVFNEKKHSRGLWNYFWIVSYEYYFNYRLIECEFMEERSKYFRITFCNISQVGNNLYLSPDARSDDGLLDCVVVRPYPLLMLRRVLDNLRKKKITQSSHTNLLRGADFRVRIDANTLVHCDGEVYTLKPPLIRVSVKPGEITVIA